MVVYRIRKVNTAGMHERRGWDNGDITGLCGQQYSSQCQTPPCWSANTQESLLWQFTHSPLYWANVRSLGFNEAVIPGDDRRVCTEGSTSVNSSQNSTGNSCSLQNVQVGKRIHVAQSPFFVCCIINLSPSFPFVSERSVFRSIAYTLLTDYSIKYEQNPYQKK